MDNLPSESCHIGRKTCSPSFPLPCVVFRIERFGIGFEKADLGQDEVNSALKNHLLGTLQHLEFPPLHVQFENIDRDVLHLAEAVHHFDLHLFDSTQIDVAWGRRK